MTIFYVQYKHVKNDAKFQVVCNMPKIRVTKVKYREACAKIHGIGHKKISPRG